MNYPTKVNLKAVRQFEESTGKSFNELATGNVMNEPVEIQLRMLHAFVYAADSSVRWAKFREEMDECENAQEYLVPLRDCLKKWFGAGTAGESAQHS